MDREFQWAEVSPWGHKESDRTEATKYAAHQNFSDLLHENNKNHKTVIKTS